MKDLPVFYKRKEECCGCAACYAVCPKSAISMAEDEEGFEYPRVDESKCIRCYLCLKVCPFKRNTGRNENQTGIPVPECDK